MLGSQTKTCFVLHGFGEEADGIAKNSLLTQHEYHRAIQSVCDELNVTCFSTVDVLHSETTTSEIFRLIYEADIVVTVLSALNPSLSYAMGIRQERKPNKTVFLSHELLPSPFDVGNIVLQLGYCHEKDKGVDFKRLGNFELELRAKMKSMVSHEQVLGKQKKNLSDESWNRGFLKFLEERKMQGPGSFGVFKKIAEDAKSAEQYDHAKALFQVARLLDNTTPKITQRLCLVTYKENEESMAALLEARGVIHELGPRTSDDAETLGLCGAIYKRMYELSQDKRDFEESLWFYNRGYTKAKDYYNGINVVFLYTKSAAQIKTKKDDAVRDFERANDIRREVLSMCNEIVQSLDFEKRDDKNWVYLTMAEAYLGLNNEQEFYLAQRRAEYYSEGVFDRYIFERQCIRLLEFIEEYNLRFFKKG